MPRKSSSALDQLLLKFVGIDNLVLASDARADGIGLASAAGKMRIGRVQRIQVQLLYSVRH